MSLLAENVPKYGRKPVGLKVEPHICGALEDEILGLTCFGDARKVSLDVGREHRNACARKTLGHHLQRDGLSGPGGTSDEAMAIGESERQPGGQHSLAYENLFVSVDCLSFGCRHYIAFSRASKARS